MTGGIDESRNRVFFNLEVPASLVNDLGRDGCPRRRRKASFFVRERGEEKTEASPLDACESLCLGGGCRPKNGLLPAVTEFAAEKNNGKVGESKDRKSRTAAAPFARIRPQAC
jgi:hypothetical protein